MVVRDGYSGRYQNADFAFKKIRTSCFKNADCVKEMRTLNVFQNADRRSRTMFYKMQIAKSQFFLLLSVISGPRFRHNKTLVETLI